MIRKSIFWGLTLVLIAALIALIVRGYKMEKEQASQPSEKVEEAKSTATRVLAPQDLEILNSKMTVEKNVDPKEPSSISHHEIEIRNSGKVSYKDVQLKFAYLNRKGKELAAKIHSTTQIITPGATLKLNDITIDGLPISIVDSKAAIISADIAPMSGKEQ
jgi:hypothetical protein